MLALGLIIAAVALAAVQLGGARSVLGSGGGSLCAPNGSSPACTVRGHNALADFQSVSTDGCIFTDTTIAAIEAVARPGDQGTSPAVYVFISVFDNCKQTTIEDASNLDSNGQPNFTGSLQFSPTLDTASASGTTSMFDNITLTSFTSTINVTWTGYGPTTTFIDSFHTITPHVVFSMSHTNSTTRAAEAQGVLTDVASNNMASPTLNASVGNTISGGVFIIRS